jgi:type II secretory pathway pseudopilin PulG
MTSGRPLTTVLGIAILAMLALTVLPAQQRETTTAARLSATTLTSLDYLEIQQLVRKSAWALDSGDNYGYAYADLFTPDGAFVGTNQGTEGRTIHGRDQLATLARGGTRGHTVQSHLTMNHIVKASGDGATGRAYVVVVDVGVVGKPNRVNHGGYYDDEYEKTPQGWRFKRRTYYESKVDVWPASAPRPGQ